MKQRFYSIVPFSIAIIIVLLFAMPILQYRKFHYYTSDEVVNELNNWWLHIDRVYKNSGKLPSIEEFFTYAKTDSFAIENFPNLIPNGLKAKDFVIVMDTSSYFYVWLNNGRNIDDTIYYSEMNYFQFLQKKGILVLKAPLSDLREKDLNEFND